MKKYINYLLCFLALYTSLCSMENQNQINKLPFELIQKICLLSESNHTNISHLVLRLSKLRVNKEWRDILEQEIFWKRAFVNLFENIIYNYGLPEEQLLRKCKKIKHSQIPGQICQIIKKSLNDIINNEQFWETAYYDFFTNSMASNSYNDLQITIKECKKILEHVNPVIEKIKDWEETLDLWLKIVSIFALVLRDVDSCSEITDAIYDFKFEEANKLIRTAKQNSENKFWNFNLLQTAIKAFEQKSKFDLTKWEGIQREMLKFIKYLIEGGNIDIDAKGFFGYTALMIASSLGLIDLIDILIRQKANINVRSNIGSRAVMFAAENGHIEVTEKLINYGADIFAKNATIYGNALGYAVKNNQLAMVEKLLRLGLDINEKFKNNWTVLMIAAQYDHTEIAKILIAAGANGNDQDIDGLTPLMIACLNLKHKMIKLLVSLSDLNIKNKKGETATQILLKLIQELEKKRVKTSKKTKKEYEIIQILVRSGTDANIKSDKGETVLEILSDLFQKLDCKLKIEASSPEEKQIHHGPFCGPFAC